MDLDLSEEQQLFQKTTRRFLEKAVSMGRVRELSETAECFDPQIWSQAGELGWFALLVPEIDGGGSLSDGAVADTCIIAEEAGRAVFPGPVIPCNVVASAIARDGSAEQRARYLPSLISGESVATWALAEPNDRWNAAGIDLRAEVIDGTVRLSGVKSWVQEALTADVFLVSARCGDELGQFLVPGHTAGMSIVPLESMDIARRFADVVFDDVVLPASAQLGECGDAGLSLDRQFDLANVLLCAETVGAVDRLYEMTLEYAQARKAFGRPIGSFQALKHRLADMLVWLEGAKAITVFAAHALDSGIDASASVSIAKSYVSERAQAIARDCLQIHGGIGYTWEHDLHYFLRRIDSNAMLFGGADAHRDRLADLIGMHRALVAS